MSRPNKRQKPKAPPSDTAAVTTCQAILEKTLTPKDLVDTMLSQNQTKELRHFAVGLIESLVDRGVTVFDNDDEEGEEEDDQALIDRWFGQPGNLTGTRYNMAGDFIFEAKEEPVDWNDFEKYLDQHPELAKVRDVYPILYYCFMAVNPVPVSVVQTLVNLYPAALTERRLDLCSPHGYTALHVYLEGNDESARDRQSPSLEVCKVLVEAEPKLLYYYGYDQQFRSCPVEKTSNGKDLLIRRFQSKAKAFIKDLGTRVDLTAVEKTAVTENEAWFRTQVEDHKVEYDNEEDNEDGSVYTTPFTHEYYW